MKPPLKKICIIRHGYAEEDRRVQKEIDALKEAGHQIDVLCLKARGQTLKEIKDGVKYYRIPVSRSWGKLGAYLLEYALAFVLFSLLLNFLYIRNRYNYIQVNTMPDFLAFIPVMPKMFGAKLIVDFHEPTPELFRTKYNSDPDSIMYKLLIMCQQYAIKWSDTTITVSEALRQRLIDRGACCEKVHVITNVCNDNIFSDNVYLHNEHNTESEFIIVTHGMIDKRYGQETLLHAMNELKGDAINIKCHILGYGPQKVLINALVKDLNLGDTVTVYDYLPFEEMLSVLKTGHVGVVAMERNAYSELIDTNKMYEYVALGIPVIASRLPVVERNFNDQCFQYFSPGNSKDLANAIMHLYQNPDIRKSLAENSQQRFQALKWTHEKKRYLNVIECA